MCSGNSEAIGWQMTKMMVGILRRTAGGKPLLNTLIGRVLPVMTGGLGPGGGN